MRELSHLENSIYKYICEKIESDGFAPSVRDICRALGIKSTSTAHSYIDKLAEKGLIHKESGKSRTLRIERENGNPHERILKVPLLQNHHRTKQTLLHRISWSPRLRWVLFAYNHQNYHHIFFLSV